MAHSKPEFKKQYENFIGGEWAKPVKGEYFENTSPIDGTHLAQIARSTEEDIEGALFAANNAKKEWANTPVAARSAALLAIADVIEKNLDLLASIETWDNGKPIRESTLADMPLAVDHFRYFAGVIRAEEGGIAQLDPGTLAMHLREPLGVVGQIIPWNFPLLMAAWKVAPALAAGNCVVLKPAEQTPLSFLRLMELIGDILPPGVLNVVTGFGPEAGKPLACSPNVDKIAFTGETTTGRLIMQYASENIIPVSMELGGKSPNVFFESIMREDDAFFDKALEGFAMFALNSGEVCTCPSRALIQESIYDDFMARALKRVEAIQTGHPTEMTTMLGSQASSDQFEKIKSYLEVGRGEGAEVLTGGEPYKVDGAENGYYIKPTVFKGNNKMRVFQEEIFGPVVSVTTFKDEAEAIEIANDTIYGLGAGVWTRDIHQGMTVSQSIDAGRVWLNCYHLYPAGASFGGYKKSGFGRENHKMMLDQYRHTKNILMSTDPNKLGFF
jgi:aldehyde dehydrogenase